MLLTTRICESAQAIEIYCIKCSATLKQQRHGSRVASVARTDKSR
eukprot:CAMPEP_0119320864 /NCGR_PEP_ID=MMETSP1333-20130426/53773_1 /TAXON_ID=418940 /ORGANISM="Scyphosphaera apsteinii, Strain RCC1455" /LENGTH=44 /DNA_ID= /DNA_START= /DNA_END= /DNA_ORIENTATION=